MDTVESLSEFHISLLTLPDFSHRLSSSPFMVLPDDRQTLADAAAEIEEQAVQLRHD